jgi:hypothetical protein
MKEMFRTFSGISVAAVLIVVMIPSISFSQAGSGLHEAVLQGDAVLVSKLLDAGADANAGNEVGITPLMEAAGKGDVKIITLLLNKGADVNAKLKTEGFRGLTPLMIAVFEAHPEAVNILLEKGADVNAKYEGRWSALTIASATDRHEIVELLIKNGADKTNLKKNAAEFKETKIGMASRKAHLAYLNATLKNAYTAAQAYFFDHPGSTITKLSQLEDTGFRINTDDIAFIKADISESSGGIVFLGKRLDASNSVAAKGLRTGEGMITFAGELYLPKLK